MTSDPLWFDTPEQAAMLGFPARYCRVIASAVNGDEAFVLLDTGSDGRSYLYGAHCHRKDGKWGEGGSSNGGGWLSGLSDPSSGTLVHFDEAPKDAEAVRIEFRGALHEVVVKDGAYLVVWWNTESPSWEEWPRHVAFRFNGEWRNAIDPLTEFLSRFHP